MAAGRPPNPAVVSLALGGSDEVSPEHEAWPRRRIHADTAPSAQAPTTAAIPDVVSIPQGKPALRAQKAPCAPVSSMAGSATAKLHQPCP
mmetsp:Transcript_56797/g.164511  ORF Transcript_56797/g.164511 Transcript_56797/m.164511 type:complete len:90 (+) Transcript_56797:82-351(+)